MELFHPVTLLSGPPGSGKSEQCLEIAQGSFVLWIDASFDFSPDWARQHASLGRLVVVQSQDIHQIGEIIKTGITSGVATIIVDGIECTIAGKAKSANDAWGKVLGEILPLLGETLLVGTLEYRETPGFDVENPDVKHAWATVGHCVYLESVPLQPQTEQRLVPPRD